ncbi:MAG: TetR/AcrR family transcriptional regulator [Coriobacteriia bacterium]|nr:TetR/AcrR family transcriptional regulator [Coriobacteriia bacterium]MCL2745687.1 TetR/AcrR family transcriptional regulator [Coriobacteriia bacterium]MCL2870463.1 TetR/AcrR family transcriptional regulator [Coriobacteriia bacterium]
MPKFSESERAVIQESLLTEGEQLFIRYGLKKVTVEDLTKEAGIAKGSFYAFYKNKEHLYADILLRIQQKTLVDTEVFLQKNCSLPPKQLVRELTLWSFGEVKKQPLLLQHDAELISHLTRKLPKEVREAYPDVDAQMTDMLVEHGVKFKVDVDLVKKVSQTLTITFFDLQGQDFEKSEAVMDILVDGVVNEIVYDNK